MISKKHLCSWVLLTLLIGSAAMAAAQGPQAVSTLPPPAHLTAEQDHQRIMGLLHISELRRGPDGDPKSPNSANFDESKIAPYSLPDPLVLKNGKKVKTTKMWWKQRRPEIAEDFDREVYGRAPRNTPKVNWEVTESIRENVGDVPVITKKLVGRVDNSSYPLIQVDIQLTLTTPASVSGPVCALRAWAWGASRALDYFETDKSVDAKQVGIEGLSRYGKAALVAMVYEPRLAIAFVGSSGAGGAKILRRNFGEQVENIASTAEYHWMAGNFLKYAGPLSVNDLPVDAHELIALCAPGPCSSAVARKT